MSPLVLTRTPTVYSMSQLAGEGASPDEHLVPAPRPGGEGVAGGAPRGVLSSPDRAVREVPGALMPLYRFPARDGFATKRLRSFGSFGDLAAAAAGGAGGSAVPDVDDPLG